MHATFNAVMILIIGVLLIVLSAIFGYRINNRTYAVGRPRLEGANAMSRAAGVDWGSLHLQPARGRLDHGVAPLSYDAAALRPSGRGAAGLARRVGRGGLAYALRPAGAVRDGPAPA